MAHGGHVMTAIEARAEESGTQMMVRVFAGPDDEHLALTGVLVMSPQEWYLLCTLLEAQDG